ncbi:MAG TPA: hypothetical protein VK756_02765 [Solirubrobacteraceae bacterium]|jgi:hypothetical protein|nr:hypothetical protein [Solirubrobacteraceae bacterium]
MSEPAAKGLRERLTHSTEDRLGKALIDLFENPLLTGALGRAADAREKATQAQELAMGALNLPSAADIERLTRRLRSVSQRLEGIEDGVHRLGRTFPGQSIDSRLGAIEDQLNSISKTVGEIRGRSAAATRAATKSVPAKSRSTKSASVKSASAPSVSAKSVSARSASARSASVKSASVKSASATSPRRQS